MSEPVAVRSQSFVQESGRSSHLRLHLALKRGLDLLFSIPSLVLLSPIFLVVAILIRSTSRGPVLFVQDRIGARFVRGRWELTTFRFLKFRTMSAGADPEIHHKHVTAFIRGDREAMSAALDQGLITETNKLGNDPRLTLIGRFLREYSLDELPQLWNVIRGDMSLVGPRPPLPYEVEIYRPEHMQRLAAKPGITGLWQISGRSALTFEEMVRLDLKYIDTMRLDHDLWILFRTPLVVISGNGE